jgi:hypothetical protein
MQVKTEIAQLVSWEHSETKDGHMNFDMKLLAANPELMEMYVGLRNRYEEVAVAQEQTMIAELGAKHDELIVAYRRAKARYDAVKENDISLRNRQMQADNVVRLASSHYEGWQYHCEEANSEFETRSEKATKLAKLEELKKGMEAAVLAESRVVAELQQHQSYLAEAAEKVNNAATAAAQCKRELDVILGVKGGHNATTGLAMA